jgi:purine-nucleoside phosphorylase
MELFDKINEATAYIQKKIKVKAVTHGIILGTGLGGFSSQIKDKKTLSFDEIPHFCKSTAISHTGQLVIGKIKNKTVVAMEGRLHFYEGYSMEEVTFPVRVMKALGVKILYISNACGGMNPQYSLGQIMFIEDHINFMGVNPLIGKNDDRLGSRFPDMIEPYSQEHIKKGREIALKNGIHTQKGVYVAVSGPNLETRAEYRFLKMMGADVVGMSTVPEVIVAVHAGIKVVGLSIVTDICLPDALKPVSIPEILSVAGKAAPQLNLIVKSMIETLN